MRRSRTGFTLIELMVAMGLAIFLMVIMSQAFVTSLDTFSGMKGIGDMQQNLRTFEVMMRDDLAQDHFTGKRRLSDIDLNGNHLVVTQKLQDGFFAVRRGSAAGSPNYVFEGNDTSGLPSFRAADHLIYMTCKRKGNRQEHFYNTSLLGDPAAILGPFFSKNTAYNMTSPDLANSTWAPPYVPGSNSAIYASQWAEVVYYLVRTGSTSAPSDPTSPLGTPTYALYRAQFVMVPDATGVNTLYQAPSGTPAEANLNALVLTSSGTFAGMSCNPIASGGTTKLTFYSPADAAGINKRVIPDFTPGGMFNPVADSMSFGAYSTGSPISQRVFAGATLVCPNVVSFQVQVMPIGSSGFDDSPAPGSPYLYDTTRMNLPGYSANYGLKAIQVTLRVFDNKTLQTRQTTIVQDL